MEYLLIPLNKDVIVHNAHSLTITPPKDSKLEKDIEEAFENGTTINFNGIVYFVDEEIK